MLRGMLFFFMSILYAFFFGAMETPDLDTQEPVFVEQEQPDSLTDTVSSYFADHPAHFLTAKEKIPEELRNRIQIIMRDEKIKKVLFPFVLNKPKNGKSIIYNGVCGLEGVSNRKQIISIGCDGLVTFCPQDDLVECDRLKTNSHPYSACLQKSAHRLFIGGLGGRMTVVDCDTQSVLKDISVHHDTLASLAIANDEKMLVAGSNDGLLHILDVNALDLQALLIGHRRAIRNAYFTDLAKKIVSISADGDLKNWDIETKTPISSRQVAQSRASNMAFLGDENRFVCAHDSQILSFGDIREPNVHQKLNTGSGALTKLIADKDGNRLVTGAWNGLIKVWDVRMLARAATIYAHKDWIQSLSELDNLSKVISGSRDSTVKVWDIDPISKKLDDISLQRTITLANLIAKSPSRTKEENWALLKLITAD